MSQLFKSLFPRVLRVRIEGQINQKMCNAITTGLKRARFVKPEAIVLTISSSGGSLTQAKNISDLLRQFSQRNNIAIYTFAEDQCLGSANAILTCGAKCHTSRMSMIGDVGYMWSSLWFQKFSEKYNIKQEFIAAGENKVKFNPFEPLREESEKWMQSYLLQLEEGLKEEIEQNRSEKFTKNKVSREDLESKLYRKGIIASEEAKEIGLIDEIRNLDDVLEERFSGVRVMEVNKVNKLQRLRESLQGILSGGRFHSTFEW